MNVVEFDFPVLTRNTKLLVYQFGQRLLRLLDNSIVAHPHIMLHSSIPFISPAPFAFRQGNNIKLYSILAPGKHIELSWRPEDDLSVLPFTDSSIIVFAQSHSLARVISINSSGEFEYSDQELVKHVMPQGLFSYIVDFKNRLLLAKNPSSTELITKCHRVEYVETKGIKALTCHVKDSKAVILSDGLYGHFYEFQNNEFESLIGVTWQRNTIALHTSTRTLLIGSSGKKRFLYETEYRIENPIHLYDDVFVGVVANKLAFYDAYKDKLKIIGLQTPNCVKTCSTQGIVAIAKNGGVILLDVDHMRFAELKKTAQNIALVNSRLLLLGNSKVAVYEVSKSDKALVVEELYEGPSALMNCTEASDKEIVCVDFLGRISILHANSVLKALPRVYKCRSTPCSSLLAIPYAPGYPLKIAPSEGIHIAFQRYNSMVTEVIAETRQRPGFLLNITLHGIVGKEEDTVRLQPSTRSRIGTPRAYVIRRLVLLNNTPLVCDKEVELPLKKCLKTLLLASELHSSTICLDEVRPVEGAEPSIAQYMLIIVERVEKVDVRPLINIEEETICFYPPALQDIELSLEVLCKSRVLTLESGCMKLCGGCDYLAMIIVARMRNRGCENRVVVHHNIVAELQQRDAPTALLERGVAYKLTLPYTCIAIASAKIVYDNHLQLHVLVKNSCSNVASTILVYNHADIVAPNSERILSIPINLEDIIRGEKALGVAEPAKASILVFPISLPHLLHLAHQIALKISASIGLRR
uniref:Uncharacterized protein n=1 Tax=Ignisphaera aggregans TaxID=334771 RepID=A0A7J3Z6V6_9CREN